MAIFSIFAFVWVNSVMLGRPDGVGRSVGRSVGRRVRASPPNRLARRPSRAPLPRVDPFAFSPNALSASSTVTGTATSANDARPRLARASRPVPRRVAIASL